MTRIRENGATTGTGVLASYAYGPLDERASLTRGNGTQATYGYDPLGRLTGLTQGGFAPAGSSVQTLSYNPAGQLGSLSQTSAPYVWTGQPAAATQEAVHDGLNRDQRIATLTGGFDANGNLTFDGTRTLKYDVQNRLTQVLNAGTETDLVYDAVDRVWQTVTGPQSNGTITRLLYDGDRLIEEWDANSGNILRRYVHGVGTDEPLVWYEGATASDATRRYLHADHQGSIIGWSDQTTTQAYTYGPYGEPQTWAGSRFRYTGQMAFSDAQIYHYKARAYDPMMGRFLQTDPIGQADDPNLYAYVRDDPVDRTDPMGTAGCTGPDASACESAQTQALAMVKKAEGAVSAYNADPSSKAGKAFSQGFKNTFGVDPAKNPAALAKYSQALGFLDKVLKDPGTAKGGNYDFKEGSAGAGRMATIKNGQPLLDTKEFFGARVHSADRVEAMIHEPLHLRGDLGLGGDHSDSTVAGDRALALSRPDLALRNPDNFARLIMGQMN